MISDNVHTTAVHVKVDMHVLRNLAAISNDRLVHSMFLPGKDQKESGYLHQTASRRKQPKSRQCADDRSKRSP